MYGRDSSFGSNRRDQTTPSNEEWRLDPERRGAAKELFDSWMTARAEAIEHLRAAKKALDAADMSWDYATAKQLKDVRNYVVTALRRAEDSGGSANEERVGNMASFGIGYRESS